ncbi:MAG: hypothetical protein FD143_2106 [Ignavibacteria bacterium]|nr:MAG: hypothetical protein FD143_2106 [Ignavibacteria bacterium]KAF0159087.1 MAG: hypothetical protein FD188_2323 [Ignavibacteria bacterium]
MARQRTSSSFRTINEVLDKEKEFEKLRERLKNYNIAEEYERIFPELKMIAKAIKVEKRVLFLKVENSVWKSELNFQKTFLIEKINKYFNETVIKSIKFL